MFKCEGFNYKTLEKSNLTTHQLTDKECDYKKIQKSYIKQECKLCENVVNNKNFKAIEDVTRNIFDILLLKLTLDGETQNVMCTLCSSELEAALNFKAKCLDRNKTIKRYVDVENLQLVDLKEIYAKEKGNEQESGVLDDEVICRLCLQSTGSDHKSIQEVPVDSIQIYIPEINFALSTNPVICIKCHDALCIHSSFIKKCLDVKKKRETGTVGVGDILFTDPCIKTEEIEIKCEQADDETLAGILGDIKKEEHDNMMNCLDVEKKRHMDAVDVGDRLFTNPCIKSEEIEIKYEDDETPFETICILENREGDTALHSQNESIDFYKSMKCELTSESLSPGHQLGHKRVSEVNESDCSNRKTKCLKVEKYNCRFNTKHEASFIKHQLVHKHPAEVPVFKCNECDYKSIRKGDLTKHHLIHKDSSEVQKYKHQSTHKDPSEVQMYACDECDYKTIRKDNLKQHQVTHKDPSKLQTYECNECDYKTFRKHHLKQHQLAHQDPSEVPVYKCDRCDYKSIRKHHLKQHQVTHKDPSEVQMYACDECDYKTIRKYHLNQHQLTHKDPSEVHMYKCGECEYISIRKDNLKEHQLTHKDPSKLQMYECNECDYKTFRKRHLKQHQLAHKDPSEVPVYKCDRCDYKSIRKHHLKQHQVTHKDPSDVPTYECEECDYKTIRKYYLKQHQLKHKDLSEVPMFMCDRCDYKSIKKGYLKKHQLKHKGSSK